MAIEYKDYYSILGVSRAAGEEEIRKAFRKLARLYHPDVTGNDRQAEDKFKELNEAYEVLGDPVRRKKYDEFNVRHPGGSFDNRRPWENPGGIFGTGQGPSPGQREHFTFTGTGFSEFFDNLFGPNGPRNSKAFDRPEEPEPETEREEIDRGEDLETDLWVTLEEVGKGSIRSITIRRAVRCTTCFGMGQYNAHACESCHGTGHTVRVETCKIRVPAGVKEGACLRIPGRGEEGRLNSPPGDLYLKVRYARHPDFRVENGQLVHELELAPWEAVLGSQPTIPTLNGSVSIRVPPGTQNGYKIRIRGKGLPDGQNRVGDLLVTVRVVLPQQTGERERQLWQELARESAFNPRHN